jgi:hypothetical protein
MIAVVPGNATSSANPTENHSGKMMPMSLTPDRLTLRTDWPCSRRILNTVPVAKLQNSSTATRTPQRPRPAPGNDRFGGHEEQLLPPMLSARSEFRDGTVVGTQGSGVMRRPRLFVRTFAR